MWNFDEPDQFSVENNEKNFVVVLKTFKIIVILQIVPISG